MSERYCSNCKYSEQSNIGLLCMGQKGMPLVPPKSKCDSWKSSKQTNADRIRAMSDEEVAEFFANMAVCDTCPLFGKMKPCPFGCKATWERWLKQEAGE